MEDFKIEQPREAKIVYDEKGVKLIDIGEVKQWTK